MSWQAVAVPDSLHVPLHFSVIPLLAALPAPPEHMPNRTQLPIQNGSGLNVSAGGANPRPPGVRAAGGSRGSGLPYDGHGWRLHSNAGGRQSSNFGSSAAAAGNGRAPGGRHRAAAAVEHSTHPGVHGGLAPHPHRWERRNESTTLWCYLPHCPI